MISDHIHFEGGGDAAFQLEREFYEGAGYEVFTFSWEPERPPELSERDFVYIDSKLRTIRKIGRFLFNPWVYRSLKNWLSAVRPDLVSVHIISKYPLSVYAALTGYRVIQTFHGPNLFCATSWGCIRKDSTDCSLGVGFKCLQKGCVSLPTFPLHLLLNRLGSPVIKRNVRTYIGPSRYICEAAGSLGFRPIEYIPLAIYPSFYNVSVVSHEGPPVIFFMGAVEAAKGPHILLDAFGIVKQRVPNAKLIYAGRGRMIPELREAAEKMGLSADVELMGFVEHENIKDILRRTHVLAVPSIWREQFGLVGPEALAFGIPCVASNIGGIPEWLHDGEWGFLTPPRDVKALAEKLSMLLLDKELRIRMGRKGRAFVLSEYDPEKYKVARLRIAEECMRA